MKKIDLGQAIAILANVCVVAGIIFLAYELRQNTLSTQLVAAQNYYAGWREVDLFLAGDAEFGELMQRAIDGEALSPAEQRRIFVFYRTRLREFDNAIFQLSVTGFGDDFSERLRDQVRGIASNDELSVRVWQRIRDRFTPEFNAIMESGLEELPSTE